MLVRTICAAALAASAHVSAASAEEITYQTHSMRTGITWMPVGDVEGHGVGTFERNGVSIMADGEVVAYSNKGTYDYTGATGTYAGYGTFTFDDGSQIIESFIGEGTATAEGGRHLTGTTRYIKGTGRFEGVSGEGRHVCTRPAGLVKIEVNMIHCTTTLDRKLP